MGWVFEKINQFIAYSLIGFVLFFLFQNCLAKNQTGLPGSVHYGMLARLCYLVVMKSLVKLFSGVSRNSAKRGKSGSSIYYDIRYLHFPVTQSKDQGHYF